MLLEIKRAFYRRLKSFAFGLLQFAVVCALSLMMLVIPSNNAVAQFPGVGSAAPSGVATQAGYADATSDAADVENSYSDENASNIASAVSGPVGGDNDGVDFQSSDSGISTPTLKKEKQRKRLFIRKLRLEFAAIDLVERKTGLPFSRNDVPRYLDELRSDLKTIATKEEKGVVVGAEVGSVARDAYHIETQLNHQIDQMLNQLGQPVPKKHFAMMPALPTTSRIAGQKLDMLALKFELADYGEKVLHAMGHKRH